MTFLEGIVFSLNLLFEENFLIEKDINGLT